MMNCGCSYNTLAIAILILDVVLCIVGAIMFFQVKIYQLT